MPPSPIIRAGGRGWPDERGKTFAQIAATLLHIGDEGSMDVTTTEPVRLENCFVICPIGPAGSDIRARSDDIFKNLICHVCEGQGIKAQRAIENSRPGDITRQIVHSVLNADLVIADLTGHNPNVFYELAIRHLVGKPFIHMTDKPESVPFDIFALNAIRLDKASYGAMRAAEAELASQIKSIKGGEVSFSNASAEIYEKLLASAKQDTSEQSKALVEEIATLQRRLADTEARSAVGWERIRAESEAIKGEAEARVAMAADQMAAMRAALDRDSELAARIAHQSDALLSLLGTSADAIAGNLQGMLREMAVSIKENALSLRGVTRVTA